MTFSNCKFESCRKKAVFCTDFCFEHTEDKEKLTRDVYKFVAGNSVVRGYNFSFIPFNEIDFSAKDLSYSVFSSCDLSGSIFNDVEMISTFFDYANMLGITMVNTNSKFCVFGGAKLRDAFLKESVVIFNNFLGADIVNTQFKNTDLSHSRFINTVSENCVIHNCNLKKTFFKNVYFNKSIRSSNIEDAILINCSVEE